MTADLILSETWKDVPGYESLYRISDAGLVYSVPRKCEGRSVPGGLLKCSVKTCRGHSYRGVRLSDGKKAKSFTVAALLLMTFVRLPEKDERVNFKNGDTLDATLNNLEWRSWNVSMTKLKRSRREDF
jgi:hypothetical protein